MSVAKETKMKEWQCNIFQTTSNFQYEQSSLGNKKQSVQLEQLHKRNASRDSRSSQQNNSAFNLFSHNNNQHNKSVDPYQSHSNKKKEGDLFLYNNRPKTPVFSNSKLKESSSMLQILQPQVSQSFSQQQQQFTEGKPLESFRGKNSKEVERNVGNAQFDTKMSKIKEEEEEQPKQKNQKSDNKKYSMMNVIYQRSQTPNNIAQTNNITSLPTAQNEKGFMKKFEPVLKEKNTKLNIFNVDKNAKMEESSATSKAQNLVFPHQQQRPNTKANQNLSNTNNLTTSSQFQEKNSHITPSKKQKEEKFSISNNNSSILSTANAPMPELKVPQPIQQKDEYFLKELGTNHQKSFERNFVKQQTGINNGNTSMNASFCSNISQNTSNQQNSHTPNYRSKICSAHDWKIEVNCKSPREIYDPKKMVQQQQRSQLESDDLTKAINKIPQAPQNSSYFTSKKCLETKLPTFLENQNCPFNVESKPKDKDVQILQIELNALSNCTNELELKKQVFKNVHVVHLETDIDNLTGKCNGKGFAQVRCSGNEQRKSFLDGLKEKGIQYKVLQTENKMQKSQGGGDETLSTMNEIMSTLWKEEKKREEGKKTQRNCRTDQSFEKSFSKQSNIIRQKENEGGISAMSEYASQIQKDPSAQNYCSQLSTITNQLFGECQSKQLQKSKNFQDHAELLKSPIHRSTTQFQMENFASQNSYSNAKRENSYLQINNKSPLSKIIRDRPHNSQLEKMMNKDNSVHSIATQKVIQPLDPKSNLLKPTQASKSKRTFI